MRHPNALLPVAVLLVISAIGCHKQDHVDIQSLRWLEKADPMVDAKKALSIGDHRLRAVYGLGISIPGTNSKDFDILKRNYGINEITGTTDAFINEEHHRLAQVAIKYSEVYNQHILNEYKPQARP